MSPDYPEFEIAVQRFSHFLTSLGVPPAVAFTSPDDIRVVGKRFVVNGLDSAAAESRARTEYKAAVKRRLGVAFEAICRVGGTTYAQVRAPRDSDDAQRRQMSDGLKLCSPDPLRSGRVARSGVTLWWYQRRGLSLRAWEARWGHDG